MSVLLWEILLTRIYSAVLIYHFAFLAVSVAIFGLTVGSLLTVLWKSESDLSVQMARWAVLTSVSLFVSIVLQLSLPSHAVTPGDYYRFIFRTYLFSTFPFIPAGAFITLMLTRFQSIGTLYACDLAGAGFACLLLPTLMFFLGAPSTVLLAAALPAGAAYLLNPSSQRQWKRWGGFLCAALAVGAMANSYHGWLKLRWKADAPIAPSLYERWNAFSRISVTAFPRCIYTWDADPGLLSNAHPTDMLMLSIDWGVGTPITRFDGDLKLVSYLQKDLTSFAHYLRPAGDMLIIGPGGGRDILTALQFQHPRIEAVEVNRSIVDAVNREFGDFSGHLDRIPSVHFTVDEGRNYIEKTSRRFELIHASLVDAGAAAAAGTYAFMENGLYTVEAWQHILRRLTPRGVFTFSRWYYGATDWPAEMYRLVTLSAAALRAEGISDLQRHVIVVRSQKVRRREEGLANILVSPSPFTDEDLQIVRRTCRDLRCDVAFSWQDTQDSDYARLLQDRPDETFIRSFPLDISPPTDDRPYFFFFVRFKELLKGEKSPNRGGSCWNTPTIKILGGLTGISLLFSTLLLIIPLIAYRWGRQAVFSWAGLTRPFLFFVLMGLGYMFIEISLIQRLGLFLGHPTYGFTVTLFALLMASGAGSWAYPLRVKGREIKDRLLLYGLGGLLIATNSVSTLLLHCSLGMPIAARILLAVLTIVPAAFFMGFCFPMGMRWIQSWPEEGKSWCWALNGAFSVTGSVLAMAVSFTGGIRLAFWAGIACYLLLISVYRPALQDPP